MQFYYLIVILKQCNEDWLLRKHQRSIYQENSAAAGAL